MSRQQPVAAPTSSSPRLLLPHKAMISLLWSHMDGVSLASLSDTSRVLGGACPAAFFKYRLLEWCERAGFRCSYSLLPDRRSVAAVSKRILLTKSLMFSDSSHHVTRQTSGESSPTRAQSCQWRNLPCITPVDSDVLSLAQQKKKYAGKQKKSWKTLGKNRFLASY